MEEQRRVTPERAAQKGFTLIEVMVAMVIAAVALSALSLTTGRTVANQSGLQNRVIATWVADNRLLEQRSGAEDSQDLSDEVEMLGMKWQIRQTLESTMSADFKKIELKVYSLDNQQDEPDAILVSIVGADS
ncbi:type II secretion system minor pseudopilin GspI [Thiomicrorhabdus sp.]|uniref:type II secretion system minor pseudopilin GspI n=1 Tax=Thiomicrorhabdus sp. TaxID=2039724 RepID=UPI0029C9877D|nr:type II secretion system minor pseudopilin GspI [Thiomicrorhabdus sp.]